MEGERVLALALNFKRGLNSEEIFTLRERYGSLEEGVEREGIELKREIERARDEVKRAKELGVDIAAFFEEAYPKELLIAPDPPVVIYLRGKVPKGVKVSIVGSRRCSEYGRRVAYQLSRYLAEGGVTVVSGLAFGVDTAAHEGALRGGKTVAVLGSSLDSIYPAANRELARRIANSGAVISEFPLGVGTRREFFPRRNRLISALGEVLVVVEAQERSGTFITVDYALKMGKEVFVVPGNIDSPFSKGTNRLISDGARPLLEFDEILRAVGVDGLSRGAPSPELPELYKLLKGAPMSADEIAQRLGLEVSRVNSALTQLEVQGLVVREGLKWSAL